MHDTEYPKIQSMFMRSQDGRLIVDNWAMEEFGAMRLVQWEATEKIDGTNIRLELLIDVVVARGRKEASWIQPDLAPDLERVKFKVADMCNLLGGSKPSVLYFEGYGGKVQAAGPGYGPEARLALIDIQWMPDVWADRAQLVAAAGALEVPLAPLVGHLSLDDAIDWCARDRPSQLPGATIRAEGLVLRAPAGIRDRHGNRLITKLKRKDIQRLEV